MMTLTRRNVLVGIALVAVVSGVALGSGAFTQVDATRNVDLGVEGDSDALLAFGGGSGATGIIVNETAGNSGPDVISLSENQLNENATTTFENALRVTNNGEDEVSLSVTGSPDMGALEIRDSSDSSISGSGSVDITADSSEEFDIVIDTTGSNDLPDSVTFTAESNP